MMGRIISEDVEAILGEPLPWERFRGVTVMVTGSTGMLGSYMAYTLAELQRRRPDWGLRLVLGALDEAKLEQRSI